MSENVTCQNCSAQCGVGARFCSSCGASILDASVGPSFDAKPADQSTVSNGASGAGVEAVMGWVILLVLLLFLVRGCFLWSERQPSGSSPSLASALTSCQYAIRSASLDKASAEVPYVRGVVIKGEASFSWPRGSGLRLKNGFGALLDASAACEVDLATNRIKFVSVNGKRVL